MSIFGGWDGIAVVIHILSEFHFAICVPVYIVRSKKEIYIVTRPSCVSFIIEIDWWYTDNAALGNTNAIHRRSWMLNYVAQHDIYNIQRYKCKCTIIIERLYWCSSFAANIYVPCRAHRSEEEPSSHILLYIISKSHSIWQNCNFHTIDVTAITFTLLEIIYIWHSLPTGPQ